MAMSVKQCSSVLTSHTLEVPASANCCPALVHICTYTAVGAVMEGALSSQHSRLEAAKQCRRGRGHLLVAEG